MRLGRLNCNNKCSITQFNVSAEQNVGVEVSRVRGADQITLPEYGQIAYNKGGDQDKGWEVQCQQESNYGR